MEEKLTEEQMFQAIRALFVIVKELREEVMYLKSVLHKDNIKWHNC
jgi:hypothetical protein